MLVYASKYTLSAFFTASRPLTVMSVSSASPRPTRYNILRCCKCGVNACYSLRRGQTKCVKSALKTRAEDDPMAAFQRSVLVGRFHLFLPRTRNLLRTSDFYISLFISTI